MANISSNKKRKSRRGLMRMGAICYSDLVFRNGREVKQILVDAIRHKRQQLGYSQKKLDNLCFFGFKLPKRKIRLPTCHEFESDPDRMNGLIFSLASGPLNLKIDEVLQIDKRIKARVSKARIHSILSEMKKHRLGATVGAGGAGSRAIPLRKQVSLSLLFRILNELG